jgi:ferredoxin
MIEISQFDPEWPNTLTGLLLEIPVEDREALPLWFSFYPLLLTGLAPDAKLEAFYQLKGKWSLAGQEDTSHYFLYAHPWWDAAKKAPLQTAPSLELTLRAVAAGIDAPSQHRLTLACLLLMTLRQAGPKFLSQAAPSGPPPPRARLRSGGGLLSTLLGRPKRHSVHFGNSSFPILEGQEITTAAGEDKRPYHENDNRCYEGLGPIPVDCRSGSCGTCWVGILQGRERLDPIGDFERKRMEYFGYFDAGFAEAGSTHPRLRLACQAKAAGDIEIVIPPWNGVFGLTRRTKELRPS